MFSKKVLGFLEVYYNLSGNTSIWLIPSSAFGGFEFFKVFTPPRDCCLSVKAGV